MAEGPEAPRRSRWAWGTEAREPTPPELEAVAAGASALLGFEATPVEAVREEEVELRQSRLDPRGSRAGLFTDDRHERLVHSLGRAYRDVVRAHRGEFEFPPDLVAFPADEAEVSEVLERADGLGAAVIPFGGGTSVVGGVEPRLEDEERPVISLDLGRLDQVVEVDRESGSALIGAGARGPVLEEQLRSEGLTLRHFPQSFEWSTLGGWIATRAGGHFATGETHIDDLVESVTAVTPEGRWESRRLPGSGAGPSPDRMMLGSEGILGVVTGAWVRVRPRPVFRARATIGFPDFVDAATGAVREIAQSGLSPANCRLVDPDEASLMGAGDGSEAVLMLGFESADLPVETQLDQAVEIATAGGGELRDRRVTDGRPGDGEGGSGSDRWKSAFLEAPYLRDRLVSCGVLTETFESAITWDRFRDFHDRVTTATREAALSTLAAKDAVPRVSCRLTHVYPDGAAPYFTVVAPARWGEEVAQWDEVKAAASEVIIEAGGTITHHHAVGRDHRPWYDRQRPEAFASALAAAKSAVDPDWILNPGVLLDPAIRRGQ
ncbi:MAG: FAD-binding oxidoreductase [Solirubrobacterales bacterium]|nr:FAD-binding oxidoreductase [Solirubrobacterales bacterium]